MINNFLVTTDIAGWDYSVYFIPLILIIIGIVSIALRIGLFEAVSGLFSILFGVIIINSPYVIINTSFLSNGTLLIGRTEFFMHPYLEMIFILYGAFLLILAYVDYSDV